MMLMISMRVMRNSEDKDESEDCVRVSTWMIRLETMMKVRMWVMLIIR